MLNKVFWEDVYVKKRLGILIRIYILYIHVLLINTIMEEYLMSVKDMLNSLEAAKEANEHYDDLFIPLSLRLERDSYAFLIALSRKYDIAKAAMAADLLKEAIGEAMGYVGEDETIKMIKQGEKELYAKKRKKD